MNKSCPHISVLANEIVDLLNVRQGKVYVDCTFGAGGYTKRILEETDCHVIAIDRDETVLKNVEKIKEQYKDRFDFCLGTFSDIKSLLSNIGIQKVAGIVCDLGVSSMQIDEAERGFSFSKTGPLSMQMGCNAESAYDVVNTYDQDDIANIIYKYGEEKFSRKIAKAIVEARSIAPIETTTALADIVAKTVRSKPNIHPATRTFQGLRIYINQELQEIESLLASALSLLEEEGRIAMVSFHSLEDRIVKEFYNEQSGKTGGTSRYLPEIKANKAKLKIITRKPVIAGEEELMNNVRSRSAKLRVAEKI